MARNVITSGSDGDTLRGTDRDDYIWGQGGNDSIYAGDGDDIIIGGQGSDHIHGGDGADTFVFWEEDGHDIIYDFEVGVDKIDIQSLGIQSLSDIVIVEHDWGIRLLFNGTDESDTTASIGLVGISKSDLSATDFIFGTHADEDGGRIELEEGHTHFHGGAGEDEFVVSTDDGGVYVHDFESEDKIDLSDFGVTDFDDLTITTFNDSTWIRTFSEEEGQFGVSVMLYGYGRDDDALTEDNFTFAEVPDAI